MELDFMQKVSQQTEDRLLRHEIQSQESREELETYNGTFDDGSGYVLGCTYGKGAWITDLDNKMIYKRKMPHYFNFLLNWHHCQ